MSKFIWIMILAFFAGSTLVADPSRNAYKHANENASFKRDHDERHDKKHHKKKDKKHHDDDYERDRDRDRDYDDKYGKSVEGEVIDGVSRMLQRETR